MEKISTVHGVTKSDWMANIHIRKWSKWQGINLQNIQAAHVAQYLKTIQSKNVQKTYIDFSKEDIQMANKHKKMLK